MKTEDRCAFYFLRIRFEDSLRKKPRLRLLGRKSDTFFFTARPFGQDPCRPKKKNVHPNLPAHVTPHWTEAIPELLQNYNTAVAVNNSSKKNDTRKKPNILCVTLLIASCFGGTGWKRSQKIWTVS